MPRITDTFDTENQFEWSYIQTTYSRGRVSEKFVIYDDGSQGTRLYDRGAILSEVRVDDPNDPDTNLWSEIRTEFDANGQVASIETTYDNGVVQMDSYSDGQLTYSLSVDSRVSDAEPWQQIERFYDAQGQLRDEITLLDTGIVETAHFASGVMTHRTQYDAQGVDAADWTEIESFYDSLGQLEREVTTLDTGVIQDETYVNGVLSYRVSYDDPGTNAMEWVVIEESFDEVGQLAVQTVTHDNGIIAESQYSDGVLNYRVEYDDPYSNAADWTRIESYYDPYTGALQAEVTFYDTGIVDEAMFDNGVLTYRVQYDDPYSNAADWERIESYYDPYTGELQAEIATYDTGIIDEKVFDAGVLAYRVQYDDPYSNAAEWQQIESYYDPYSGELQAEVTQFDNGVVGEDVYDNGSLVTRMLIDNPYYGGGGAFDWTAMTEQYEADQLLFSATLYDNGDYARSDFDADGMLAAVWEYDGDGDMDWLGRRSDYDPDGNELAVTLWYDGDPLPSELDPYAMAYF